MVSIMGNSTADEVRTEKDCTECCRQCGSNESTAFSSKDLAITGCLAFVAGAVLVLLILFIIRLKRDKKLCFKEKEEPFKGKWEGASQKATIQVLKKHTLERSQEKDIPTNEDQSRQEVTNVSQCDVSQLPDVEPVALNNKETETRVNTEETNQELECVVEVTDVANNENGGTNVTQQNVSAKNDHGEDLENEPEIVPSDNNLESDELISTERTRHSNHLYEKSRGSSVYDHGDLVLQNANFRISALSNM